MRKMRVWVYPEKKYRDLGERRYEVEWFVPPKNWNGEDDLYPEDMIAHVKHYGPDEHAKAVKAARLIVNKGITAYGDATVTEQVVDWYVEEDQVAEWVNVGEPEYVA